MGGLRREGLVEPFERAVHLVPEDERAAFREELRGRAAAKLEAALAEGGASASRRAERLRSRGAPALAPC